MSEPTQADLDAMWPVVEAAQAMVKVLKQRGYSTANQWFIPETAPFVEAVDAYRPAQEETANE